MMNILKLSVYFYRLLFGLFNRLNKPDKKIILSRLYVEICSAIHALVVYIHFL